MQKEKKLLTGKQTTWILLGVLFICITGIGILQWAKVNEEMVQYEMGNTLFSHSEQKNEYIDVNANQVIRLTQDGITAYDLKGNEMWNNALTLDKPIVKHKGNYFAIANKDGKKVYIFNEKGKRGEVQTTEPIIYFSVNTNGDVATIEKTEDGHITSAYSSSGELLGVKGVSYIKDAGFPISAEVSPDRQLLLVSYVDLYNPVVSSVLNAIIINKTGTEEVFNAKYGIDEKDNIIYEIEFINQNTWVAIGDSRITFYNMQGEKIKEIPNLYLKYTPYVDGDIKGSQYLPVVSTGGGTSSSSKDKLSLFNTVGEEISSLEFDRSITYFNATEKGVILGQGQQFIGYNKKGEVKFTFEATQDVSKVLYVGNKLIAVTKNEVKVLNPMNQRGTK
ncbi:MAG: DUF5711 family protein [Niameybacter sp.]|uniref:DUF5711 family protein n=1 Tax=Niameybacter sp. TaxID=2033640 RepID=UPI002FCA4FC0